MKVLWKTIKSRKLVKKTPKAKIVKCEHCKSLFIAKYEECSISEIRERIPILYVGCPCCGGLTLYMGKRWKR